LSTQFVFEYINHELLVRFNLEGSLHLVFDVAIHLLVVGLGSHTVRHLLGVGVDQVAD